MPDQDENIDFGEELADATEVTSLAPKEVPTRGDNSVHSAQGADAPAS
jgi:hypothetical protein